MRQLRRVGLEFLDVAPLRLRFEAEVAAPPRAVFAAISGDPASWRSWFPGFASGRYESAPPYGVGSIRAIRMSGTVYRETILAWDEPARWVFRVDECTVPIARALVEEWSVTERGTAAAVRWTFAIDPAPLFRAATPLARPVMGWLFRRAMRNLERELGAERPATTRSVLPGE